MSVRKMFFIAKILDPGPLNLQFKAWKSLKKVLIDLIGRRNSKKAKKIEENFERHSVAGFSEAGQTIKKFTLDWNFLQNLKTCVWDVEY